VLHQLVGTDRRVPDPEGPDDLLVEPLLRQPVAGGAPGRGLPQKALEELAGVRQQGLDAIFRSLPGSYTWCSFDKEMLPDPA
jgi:hypothetical protein